MNDSVLTPRYFIALEQTDFQKLEHAHYLKGLLRPFKGKGTLATWASECHGLRDDLIALAERRVLPQARAYPFNLLGIQLAQQNTGAGTSFLRWHNLNRTLMTFKIEVRRVGILPYRINAVTLTPKPPSTGK